MSRQDTWNSKKNITPENVADTFRRMNEERKDHGGHIRPNDEPDITIADCIRRIEQENEWGDDNRMGGYHHR